jgi:type II secretory pathway component PulF
MMIFIIPQILSVFDEIGPDKLPLPTKILIAVSNFMNHNAILVVLIVIAVVAAFSWGIKTDPGRRIWHRFLLTVFIISPIIKKINLARFTRTLASLLRTDIPIVQSLQITSDIVRNVYYHDAMLAAAVALGKGEQISSVLAKSPKLFPPLVVQMVAVGERAGTVDQMLEEIAEYYESQVNQTMANLSSIIEPILILVLGAAVAGIALAIITPIYSMDMSFGQ